MRFWQDVRYGVRMLIRQPGFTLIAVLTLALGIGATTAIFSVVNAVLLRPLPFRDSERLVTLWENNIKDGIERDDVSPANFLDWRERSRSFEEMAFANPWSLDYTGGTEPETWRTARVSHGFFDLLGAQPLVGRIFLAEEYQEGRNQAVVLSYGLWQRRFGGDAGIVGQKLILDDRPMTVVGVMPADFKLHLFEQEELLWQPQTPDESMRRQRRATYLKVVARLKPDATIERARAEMDSIAANLAVEYPQTNAGVGVTAAFLTEHMTGRVRPALWVLFGAVGFVLAIACTNVANLVLARGSEREREFAVRAAIGAGRGRIVRQLMTESLLLALAGGVAGLLAAVWGMDLIVALAPGDIPRLETVGPDRVAFAFSLGVSVLTAAAFGLAPALHFSKPDLSAHLKGGAASAGAVRRRLRGALIIAEVALALVLLVGAGLLLRSFARLLNADPGFASGSVIALQTFIWDRYRTPQQRAGFVAAAMEKLRNTPGVQTVGAGTSAPFLGSSMDSSLPFTVEGRPAPPPGQEPTVFYGVAASDYFASLGVPLKRGRLFNDFDTADSPRVVIINEEMARRHFPNEDPVGRSIGVRGGSRGQEAAVRRVFEIVGVVGNVLHDGLDRAPRPEYFQPFAQSPTGSIIFTVRIAGDPAAMIPALKARIWEVNETQPVYAVAALGDLISDSLRTRRFSLVLLGAFAALALVLAVTGIYGVVSHAVRQQTREIGIRAALGADAGDVMKMVIGRGLALTFAGVAVGLVAAFGLTRLMQSMLYGVEATDPLTYGVVAVLLMLAAAAACYAPARRAARVDPLQALRCE
ncbi:MAG: ABC transporter permease [Acidobacteria bacterium]|nr:ABC transporter permease [Acidobacteriota bacterium]MCW5971282.1 ABC transporter permease [Blastocatellales bacterium]